MLYKEVSASQLAEWKAYHTLSPIGEERADFRFSYLSAVLTNIAIRTHGKQGAKLSEVKDHLFNWDPEFSGRKEQSVEEMKAVFTGMLPSMKEQEQREINRKRRKPKRLRK